MSTVEYTIENVDIQYLPLSEIRSASRNPKDHDLGAIHSSIARFGFTSPLLLDERTEKLVAGHGRIEALRSMKASGSSAPERIEDRGDDWYVPVLRGLRFRSDEDAEAYLLADNRLTELGGWNDSMLAEVLSDLAAADALEGVGWDEDDIDELLAGLGENGHGEGLTDPDDVPEPPEEPVSQRGDVWLLGSHRVMCGDATSVEDVERLMAGEKAVLMATDPPYLVDYDGSGHPQSKTNTAMTKDKQWDAYKDPTASVDFYREFISVARSVAIDERAPIYQWHAVLRMPLVSQAWEANGLLLHQVIVWVKGRPVLTRHHFMWQSEPAAYGWLKGYQPELDRRPPSNASNVWEVDQRSANDIHPTEKPIELFRRPLEWHTRGGEVCYEPFAGSGTQVIAAEMLGRRCYGMEIAPQYVDVICRRYQEYTGTKPVLESTSEEHDFQAAA